jgi:hypothetical protein
MMLESSAMAATLLQEARDVALNVQSQDDAAEEGQGPSAEQTQVACQCCALPPRGASLLAIFAHGICSCSCRTWTARASSPLCKLPPTTKSVAGMFFIALLSLHSAPPRASLMNTARVAGLMCIRRRNGSFTQPTFSMLKSCGGNATQHTQASLSYSSAKTAWLPRFPTLHHVPTSTRNPTCKRCSSSPRPR